MQERSYFVQHLPECRFKRGQDFSSNVFVVRVRRNVFVMGCIIVTKDCHAVLYQLITIFRLNQTALFYNDKLRCRGAIFDSLFNKFKVLDDIVHLSQGLFGVDMKILGDQMLITFKQAGPFHEITTVVQ